jgi:glycerophosphoryl diester phosphodiesterase
MKKWQKRLVWLLVLILTALGIGAFLAAKAPSHTFFSMGTKSEVLVIAHQGGEGLRPSNTMASFQNAADLGVDILEMDIHSTRDGVLVVIHDDTIDRTTDGSGRVNDFTFSELQQFDAGYYWTSDDGQTYPYRGQGITIPALEQVLAAFPEFRMNIEIKQTEPDISGTLCELLRTYERSERTLVASFHAEPMIGFRAACPESPTSLHPDEIRAFYVYQLLYLPWLYEPDGFALQVPEERDGIFILSSRFVRSAQGRNLDVHAWTINDPAEMVHFIDLGVDGIITDYPDLLLEILAQR